MSKRYIPQLNNTNFVFPNYDLAEYDIDIIHDLNENSISGTVYNLLATSVSTTAITISYYATWSLNGAEPFITTGNNINFLSVHCMTSAKAYYKPWRLVDFRSAAYTGQTTTNLVGVTFTMTPSDLGLTGFTTDTLFFEFRMIGEKSIFPICQSLSVSMPTATPTPTPSFTPSPTPTGAPITNTPTPTPTATGTPTVTPIGPTFTPTPTPTSTPTATPVVYTYSLGYDLNSGTVACSDYSTSPANYYSYNPPPLANGHILYTGNTQPLTGNAITGYYSDGTNYGYVSGNSGVINGLTSCNAPTVTPTPTATPVGQGFGTNTGTTFSNASSACLTFVVPSTTLYLNADVTPNVGDYFYTTVNCTPGTEFVGNSNFYRVVKNPNTWALRISPFGDITEVVDCSTIATPTPTPTATNTPTPTATNTPTPSPTPTPVPFTACLGNFSIGSTCACDGNSFGSWSFQGNGSSLCTSSVISSTGIASEIPQNGVFWVSDGSNVREYTRNGNTNSANANDVCFSCPTATPTPTPSATPTNTPTPLPPTFTPTPTVTNTPTPTPVYNYYEFTPCAGGSPVYYRSISSLALGDFYSFSAGQNVQCYEITDINAAQNTNDLPTIYSKTGCADSSCVQQ